MGTMTKADIVNAIIIQTGQDRRVVTEFVEMFIEAIKEHREESSCITYNTDRLRGTPIHQFGKC